MQTAARTTTEHYVTFRPLPYRRDIIVSRGTQARLALFKYETSIAAFTHVRPNNITIHENLKIVT
jgi:hypothetical protein